MHGIAKGRRAAPSSPHAPSNVDTIARVPAAATPPAAAPAGEPEWRPPLPLAQELDAAAFPLAVLPRPLLPFIDDVAAATNCPVDIVALPLLTLAGAAIGASRALEIKAGWIEFPCLWGVVIAPPGNAKSAAIKFCAEPFFDEQKELLSAFQTDKRLWQKNCAALKEPPPPPELQSVYCKDITREQLGQLLGKKDNWRGFPRIYDEILGFIHSMDEYKSGGRGGDRQFHLDLWNCGQTRADRRNLDDPNILAEPVSPIVGGTQPSKLPDLRGRGVAEDGFIDRFLPSFPEPKPPLVEENWLCVSRKVRKRWADVVRYLWGLVPVYHGNQPGPRVVYLTDSGKEAWVRFTRFIGRLQRREDLSPVVHNTVAKLKTYGIRLALVVHFLRLATGEVEYEDVDGQSVKRATQLVAYFFSHIQKLHGVIESDPRLGDAQRVLRFLERRRDIEDFSAGELRQYMRRYFRRVESLSRPLWILVEHHYLASYYPELGSRPGPRTQRYRLNPLWKEGRGARGEGRGEALAPPWFELTAQGLAQCWVYHLTRLRQGQKADRVGDVTPAFAELLRQGFAAAELLTAIQDDGRNRGEHFWQFEQRLRQPPDRNLVYNAARSEASQAELERIEKDARLAEENARTRQQRWQAVPEAERAGLRQRARARWATLAQKADGSALLIDACLRLWESNGHDADGSSEDRRRERRPEG
jgi:hypothetical protein